MTQTPDSVGISRRGLTKLTAAAAAGTLLGVAGAAGQAQAAYVERWHGPVMTRSELNQLADCIAKGGYTCKKLVNASWASPTGGWNHNNMITVCHNVPGQTIVRTLVGDGGFPGNFPTPQAVYNEIKPWYDRHNWIWIEIGNEPNSQEWSWASWNDKNNYIWNWRYYFGEALAMCRREFPRAKVISPGLGPLEEAWWHDVCKDKFSLADYVGFHAFTPNSYSGDVDWLSRILPVMSTRYGGKQWFLTEYGINNPAMKDADKGREYAGMVHFGASRPSLPANVIGATYFHLDTYRTREPEYHIYDGGGDAAYKRRTG